jgi:hypothetical protein
MNIVPFEQSSVDLALLAHFTILQKRMLLARARYAKLYKSVLDVANTYYADDPLSDVVVRLRREIRLATKGTPLTIEQSAITAGGYVSFGTEQLFNAQSHMAKAMYRKLAPLVHPDHGGDLELFQLVNAAYHLRDLTFLQETYFFLTKDTVFWRCREGINYMQQEIQRPEVSLRMLQNRVEFKITRLHLQKQFTLAAEMAQENLKRLVIELQNELTYLLTKSFPEGEPHGYQEDGNQSSDQEGTGQDRSEEGSAERRVEDDAAGEGTPSSC